MQTHTIKPKNSNQPKNRVGRGGKKGTYSGKGVKGQLSRSGKSLQPIIREVIKRYPKLKGYRVTSKGVDKVVLNVSDLQGSFNDKDVVSPEVLVERNIVRTVKGKMPKIKILGNGDLKKAVQVQGCEVSVSAKEKIEKAGGSVS